MSSTALITQTYRAKVEIYENIYQIDGQIAIAIKHAKYNSHPQN